MTGEPQSDLVKLGVPVVMFDCFVAHAVSFWGAAQPGSMSVDSHDALRKMLLTAKSNDRVQIVNAVRTYCHIYRMGRGIVESGDSMPSFPPTYLDRMIRQFEVMGWEVDREKMEMAENDFVHLEMGGKLMHDLTTSDLIGPGDGVRR